MPMPIPVPVPELEAEPIQEEKIATPRPAMVRIEGGCFQMGSPMHEESRRNNEPQHKVCVQNFEIGKYEVTVGEFRRFVEATRYRTDAERNADGKEGCYIAYREGSEWTNGYQSGFSWKEPNFKQDDNHPVVCVSWNDAVAYAEWLTKQTGENYRLPSEAEWEYAARAGTTSARYWGDDPNQACRYANVGDRTAKETHPGWTIHDCTDNYVYTAPVGRYSPNAWRLHDMLGNVWEWTCSRYDADYNGLEEKCADKDTIGPRAVHGGSWGDVPAGVRSAFRSWVGPALRFSYWGFRLARSL